MVVSGQLRDGLVHRAFAFQRFQDMDQGIKGFGQPSVLVSHLLWAKFSLLDR
jgi:hypothetical protein